MASFAERASALIGVSAYDPPRGRSPSSIPDRVVNIIRRAVGGQLATNEPSQTRWYLTDVENAERDADQGDLRSAALLMREARKDGVLAGLLSTRTGGLVRLDKRFRGDPAIVAALELGHTSIRSVFDEMLPAAELALLGADGITLGVGVGELVPVPGRDFPVFVRLDPVHLRYRWAENRWFYNSVAGPIEIIPGDGRWVLHVPGGRHAPWNHGLWKCLARAYVRKEHAALKRDNWESKLANPARVAVSPTGAAEEQAESWFAQVAAWGINTVFSTKPGYDVKLLESNGRGWDSFNRTIEEQNNEYTIAIAGQTVTTDGGAGFSNSDIHKSIRADLIKETADGLAYTLNTQALPPWIFDHFGEAGLLVGAQIAWDVAPPKDRAQEAQSLVTIAQAISQLDEALKVHEQKLDVAALASKFGIPILNDVDGDGIADVKAAEAAGDLADDDADDLELDDAEPERVAA